MEWFNDLVFTVVRGAVILVRSGEVISVFRELEDQVISFNLNMTLKMLQFSLVQKLHNPILRDYLETDQVVL